MLILLSSGEYSDYTIYGCYEAPSVEWVKERAEEYKATKSQEPYDCGADHEFVDWLRANHGDQFKLSDYKEVWIGAYGNWSKEFGGTED